MLLHNNRASDDGVKHKNENIDNEKTIYNYFLKRGTTEDFKNRLDELFVVKKQNTTVLGEMIVTLPMDVKEEDERDFFQSVYDFYRDDFGEENIVNAVVHRDEKRPHLHLDFIPVVEGEPQYKMSYAQKEKEKWIERHGSPPASRICCKEKITRTYLQQMHPRLSAQVKKTLGYEVSILNGATINGNRTILQLKTETLKKDISKLETYQKYLGNEIGEIVSLAKKSGLTEKDVGLYPLLQKIADLENQNEILKNIITRQDYRWKKEDIEAMKSKKYVPAQSVMVNIFDGSLVDAEIEENAVVVIELPQEKPLPQQALVNRDIDLQRQINFVLATDKKIMLRQARMSDRFYLFIKTDNSRQTIDNLLLMEQKLREIDNDLQHRMLYMDKMATDEYDLARTILMKNNIKSFYFENRNSEQKIKENDLEGDRHYV